MGSEPKLAHVTPLYVENPNGGEVCIYSYAICRINDGLIKCSESPKPLALEGTYGFYLGFHSKII